MTYVDYVNKFWGILKYQSLPASVVAVYFYLLNECNSRRWRMPFYCSSLVACETMRMTKQTFNSARKKLVEIGMITYKDGTSRFCHASYTILDRVNNLTEKETVDFTEDLTVISKLDKDGEKDNIDSSLRSESPSSLPTTVKGEEINFLAFMEFFNGTMQHYGAQIPTITQITPKRRQALAARAREHGKEALRTAVINAATAPFLNGASDKPFVANFDWIFRPTNFVKVLEGNYNHEITNPNTTYHATGNNNGYRTSEDLRQGAASIITRMEAEGRQSPK